MHIHKPRSLVLELLKETYAICRLPLSRPVSWANGELVCVAQAARDEVITTVICLAESVPADVEQDGGWRALRLEGPFSFGETGVLASVLAVLAEADVPVLTVCTFETDYVLFKAARHDRVRQVLEAAGHRFL